MAEESTSNKHTLTLSNKNDLFIEGVKGIEGFDSNEFFIETIMGHMLIKGKGLTLGKMDNDNEQLTIKGEINSLEYVANKEKANQSFFKKIFKW